MSNYDLWKTTDTEMEKHEAAADARQAFHEEQGHDDGDLICARCEEWDMHGHEGEEPDDINDRRRDREDEERA